MKKTIINSKIIMDQKSINEFLKPLIKINTFIRQRKAIFAIESYLEIISLVIYSKYETKIFENK